MGDSITQFWHLPDHNAGIAGQTTAQMLDRFRTDVVGHGFKRVVILGGTNDVDGNLNLSDVSVNIDAMATIAEAAGIEVILCKIPPRVGFDYQVMSVNQEITTLAQSKGFPLVDYYTPMLSHSEFFRDGVHPNSLGYATMETVLSETVIQ
jgi:lysophospholipase L1-like esterase